MIKTNNQDYMVLLLGLLIISMTFLINNPDITTNIINQPSITGFVVEDIYEFVVPSDGSFGIPVVNETQEELLESPVEIVEPIMCIPFG